MDEVDQTYEKVIWLKNIEYKQISEEYNRKNDKYFEYSLKKTWWNINKFNSKS